MLLPPGGSAAVSAIAQRETMRAVVWTAYGSPEVLVVREVPRPSPGDGEVLVRVHAASVFAGDCELRRLDLPLLLWLPLRFYFGWTRPKRVTVLGQELAGEVTAVGRAVSRYKPGDQVFAATGFRLGGYAEYACLPEDAMMARKPANLTMEEAATLPVGGYNALHFMTLAHIQRGERVLINGAGGSIGTVAIQLAKAYGAEVTAVDAAHKLDLLRSIGADEVIDFAREDFTRRSETYDVIFDVVGKAPFLRSLRVLNRGGRLLLGNNGLVVPKLQGAYAAMTGSKKVISRLAGGDREDIVRLRELVEAGKVRAVIDKRYPLERVAEAHRYVEAGLKKGTAAVTVVPGDTTKEDPP